MQLLSTVLRGATLLGLAAAIFSATIATPAASAAPLNRVNGNDNEAASDDDSGIADVPIVGDLVGGFESAEPEEIAVGAVQLTAGAAETVIPIIFQFVK